MAVSGASEPSVGDVLGNKYRITGKIGAGGMATVYSAENIVTHKRVALKWLHPGSSSVPDVSARFLREAQAASRLTHPNVVDVYDLIDDTAQMFMVMELLEGETLRAYLKRVPRPKVSEFLALLLPALEGVAAAHDHGVVHRDLKPDNIFLANTTHPGGVQPKVLDFGVAMLSESHALGLTRTGTTLGTPLYMSLEQLRGDKEVDGRTDVYAFGVMLYEALSGRRPYDAITLSELAIKVATAPAPRLKAVAPELPTPLARVIDWAIEKQPADRLPSVRALIRELEPFSREHGFRAEMTNGELSSPRLPVYAADGGCDATLAVPAPRPRDTFTGHELPALPRSHTGRKRWLALAAGALLCGLSSAMWLTSQREIPTGRSARAAAPTPQPQVVARIQSPDAFVIDESRADALALATTVSPLVRPDAVEPGLQATPLPAAEPGPRRSKRRPSGSAEPASAAPPRLAAPEPRKQSAAELLGF